jgi:hypothetical protein
MFIANQQFRDDVINSAFIFIEQITPTTISEFLSKKYSDAWFEKLKAEYKINNFDSLSTNIYNKFVESATYAFTNRNSIVTSNNYGKPLTTKPKLDLSKNEIKDICKTLLANATDFYLTKLDIKKEATAKNRTDASLDEVGKVTQRYESNTKIDTTAPERKIIEIKKPLLSDKELEFKRKLIKEFPVVDEPKIGTPVERDKPIEIKLPIEYPDTTPISDEKPIVIETPAPTTPTPIYGGGGTRGTRDFITDYGNGNPWDSNYGKVVAGEPNMDYQK